MPLLMVSLPVLVKTRPSVPRKARVGTAIVLPVEVPPPLATTPLVTVKVALLAPLTLMPSPTMSEGFTMFK